MLGKHSIGKGNGKLLVYLAIAGAHAATEALVWLR